MQKTINLSLFCNLQFFLQFFELLLIFCIGGNFLQDHKIDTFMVFYAFFNAPKFMPFFVLHCGKFTPVQSKFYDGKFTVVNLKKA